MFDLSGQVAVVTGASSGLGVVFAKRWPVRAQMLSYWPGGRELLSEVGKRLKRRASGVSRSRRM